MRPEATLLITTLSQHGLKLNWGHDPTSTAMSMGYPWHILFYRSGNPSLDRMTRLLLLVWVSRMRNHRQPIQDRRKTLNISRAPATSANYVCNDNHTDRTDEADILPHVVGTGTLASANGQILQVRIHHVANHVSITLCYTATVQYFVVVSQSVGCVVGSGATRHWLQGKCESLPVFVSSLSFGITGGGRDYGSSHLRCRRQYKMPRRVHQPLG